MLKFLTNTRLFFVGLIKISLVSKIKNLHKTVPVNRDEVIILGNGPSLANLISDRAFLDRLKSLDSIAVNTFCNQACFEEIKPKYYMLAAPDFWLDGVKEDYIKLRNAIFEDLASKVDWELYLFIPWPAKKKLFWQKVIAKNTNIKVIYFNIVAIEGGRAFRHFCYDRRFGSPRLHNVIGPSIMNMLWLNYKKIYLVGVEHSWLTQIYVDENNNALVGQPHFYDKDAKPDRMNGVDGVGHRKLHEILHKFYLAFKGYFEVQNYATVRKTEIINLTPDSFIDAFPRQKLDIFIKNHLKRF